MRIFTVSDLHIDYDYNKQWVLNISAEEYKNDVLILAGDVTDNTSELSMCFLKLAGSFKKVLFVPGNHDLWVRNRILNMNSFEKLQTIRNIAYDCGIIMQPYTYKTLTVIPLYGWYDFSFGKPDEETVLKWADFTLCKWPDSHGLKEITKEFLRFNNEYLNLKNENIITFSHFLPDINVMPCFIPASKRDIYPMLGSDLLGKQVEKLGSDIHVYGHSHVNAKTRIGKTTYINNAFGYPSETRICKKALEKIFEVD